MYRKEIKYDRATRDYAMYLDGELVGFARTYHEAEIALDQLVFELMTAGHFHAATEMDGDADPVEIADQHNEALMREATAPHYTRAPEFDKRPYGRCSLSGDAWRDQLGMLRWVEVGADPNT